MAGTKPPKANSTSARVQALTAVILPETQSQASGGGSATAAKAAPQRTTDRITIAISVEISGMDLSGCDFLEQTRTEHVSRNGASIVLNRLLAPDQQVNLRRTGSAEAPARIVGQIGIRPEGHVYGVALLEPGNNLWGICFPPKEEYENALARLLLQCSACSHCEVIALDEVEFSVFEANGRISRACRSCNGTAIWQTVSADGSDLDASEKGKQNRRKHTRSRMKANACVSQPGTSEDMVQVVDFSRGGICFRSARQYRPGAWVQVAVPYTSGTANIFLPGRIVWQRNVGKGITEYGAQYVKS